MNKKEPAGLAVPANMHMSKANGRSSGRGNRLTKETKQNAEWVAKVLDHAQEAKKKEDQRRNKKLNGVQLMAEQLATKQRKDTHFKEI